MGLAARRDVAATIGTYRVVKSLGVGFHGPVFLGVPSGTNVRVAVKQLRASPTPVKAELEGLLATARRTCELKHPNIVPVYEVGEEFGLPFVVYEYAEAATLKTLVRKGGALLTSDALSIAQQVLDALAAAHDAGIWHGDITANNVVLPDDRTPRITDFGIAGLVPWRSVRDTVPNARLVYVAPECLQDGTPGVASDVYAVGALLHEMLSGAPPFGAPGEKITVARIVHEVAAPLSKRVPGTDPKLETLVQRALSKNPDDRFADAAEMKEALEAATGLKPRSSRAPQSAASSLLRKFKGLFRRT